jgi:hypothetical protein
MSIKLSCNDETIFEIPYIIWLDIKSHIIGATFEYLSDKFEKDKSKYSYITDTNHPNYIGNFSSYYGEMMDLQYINDEIMKHSNNNDNIMIHTFLKMCNMMNCVNTLYHFDVGGLYTLCSKSEHGGYYSPGNSLDICLLLNIIRPFINDCEDYEYFHYIYGEKSIYDAFSFSHTSLQKLYIF